MFAGSAQAVNYFSWGAECTAPCTNTASGTLAPPLSQSDNFTLANGAPGTTISTTVKHSGNSSMKLVAVGNDGGNQNEGAEPLYQGTYGRYFPGTFSGSVRYYRWWMRMESGWSWGNAGIGDPVIKVIRESTPTGQWFTVLMSPTGFQFDDCDDDGVGGSHAGVCWTNTGLHGANTASQISVDYTHPTDDVWREYILKIKQPTSFSCTPGAGCDSEFTLYINGAQIDTNNGWKLVPDSGTVNAAGMHFAATTQFYFQIRSSVAAGGTLYLDDFSLDDTFISTFSGGGDTTAPTGVAITAPSNGATVSGSSTTVTASCSDNVAVSGVQMLLDGASLASQDTTSPYSITWNTTTATNGTHTLSARCTDTNNNQTTSSTVSVTVSNSAPTGECPSNWKSLNPTWIWCDDFESDTSASWVDRNNPSTFLRSAGNGQSSSYSMRATYPATTGAANAGDFKIAFGASPVTPKINASDNTKYTELYWRTFIRTSANWLPGTGAKLTRATGFVNASWVQSFITHWWDSATAGILSVDPVSTVCRGGLKPDGITACTNNIVLATGWNDFTNFYWLGINNGTIPVLQNSHANIWQCLEGHTKLNASGVSDGVQELWIDGVLDAQKTGLNLVGTYSTYGINIFSVENYMNAGTGQSQYRDWDNLVLSTTRVKCTVGGSDTTPPAAPTGLGLN
jgi:hypothetical protein